MADAKYGRLFTEADVRALIQRAFRRLGEPGVRDTTLAELIEVLDGEGQQMTFPADEPLLLLRGSEPATVALLAAIHGNGSTAGRAGD